jgi:hypothetical protein
MNLFPFPHNPTSLWHAVTINECSTRQLIALTRNCNFEDCTLLGYFVVYMSMGDSRGKVSILGGNSIGHCKKKKFRWTCVYFWMVTETELFETTNTKAFWMVKKR